MEKVSDLTYEELTRELFPRLTGGIRWGLERTRELLERVGNPHHAFRSIHVGGTNGKGSVAATLAAILTADGRKTGLYSSPHLCTFRERIQVDGFAYKLLREQMSSPPQRQVLSPREQEIVRLVAKGLPSKAIADVLYMSTWTVGSHLRRVFAKLGVSTRAEMVAQVLEGKLLDERAPETCG